MGINRAGRIIVILFAVFALSLTSGVCDIYTFVDENGVKHFTNVPHLSGVKYHVFIKNPSVDRSTPSKKARYDDLISEASKRYGVSEPLLKALIKAESNFNPKAVSKKGAKGLMQLMPENIQDLRVSDPFDPRENIMGGTRFFKRMINRYRGKLSLAIAAYNAGPEKVDQYRSVPPYKETEKFVKRVLEYYQVYRKG